LAIYLFTSWIEIALTIIGFLTSYVAIIGGRSKSRSIGFIRELMLTIISSTNIGNTTSVIVEAGYLVRSVYIEGTSLNIEGDLNATTPIKIIGAPANTKDLKFNSKRLDITIDPVTGDWSSTLEYIAPTIMLPDLSALEWKYLDNLPEIQNLYDDSAWLNADHMTSTNPFKLRTPTSLFASDYGYNSGVLIYRGHFIANGKETNVQINTQGGSAYGTSVWLNTTYLGSWPGTDRSYSHNDMYSLPNLVSGKSYVFTIVIDNMGLDENWNVGGDDMKQPRGILNYTLSGHAQSDVIWKLTGNLGGEDYIDKVRGPLNEGGLYAERQGFTQPFPPNKDWTAYDPGMGVNNPGIAFYQTDFRLDLPAGYDIPLSFNFGNTTVNNVVANYRAQLWVNGYQLYVHSHTSVFFLGNIKNPPLTLIFSSGKYINNIGPQASFPVPQGVSSYSTLLTPLRGLGILNYHGQNWLAIELWVQQTTNAHLTNFTLRAGTVAWTAMSPPALAPMPSYSKRAGAY
jgi:Beta-galactosidase jelly roll domain/Beta-galactosidase, domain 3